MERGLYKPMLSNPLFLYRFDFLGHTRNTYFYTGDGKFFFKSNIVKK